MTDQTASAHARALQHLDELRRLRDEVADRLSQIDTEMTGLDAAVATLTSTPAVARVALTVEEAASALGVSRATLYRMMQSDPIPRVRLGKVWRIPVWWVDQVAAQSGHKAAS